MHFFLHKWTRYIKRMVKILGKEGITYEEKNESDDASVYCAVYPFILCGMREKGRQGVCLLSEFQAGERYGLGDDCRPVYGRDGGEGQGGDGRRRNL